MTERNRPISESELLDALRGELSRAAPPGSAARVRQHLHRTVSELATGGVDPATAAGSQRVLARPARRRPFFLRSASISVAALLMAGGVGAAIHAALLRRVAKPVERTDRPAVTEPAPPRASPPSRSSGSPIEELPARVEAAAGPEAAASPEGAASARPNPAPVASPANRVSHIDALPLASPASILMAERALLDRARTAFSAGEYGEAERALGLHSRKFPAGLLAEEREALAIRTLAGEGRGVEARSRAARFHERFPRSLFASAVDNAVRAIP